MSNIKVHFVTRDAKFAQLLQIPASQPSTIENFHQYEASRQGEHAFRFPSLRVILRHGAAAVGRIRPVSYG